MKRRSQQPRQPELLLLHCRTASDVEPTLVVGERTGWIGHVSRLLLTTLRPLIYIACRNCHAPPPLLPPPPFLLFPRCRVPGQPAAALRFSLRFLLGKVQWPLLAAERRRAQPYKSRSMNLKRSPAFDSRSSSDSCEGSVKQICHCTLNMMNSICSPPLYFTTRVLSLE